ncbi:methyltransferase LaeA [Biscogniauxia mediterranea]|nr:methyltransferase LaeA [Biscogniauxia mediterranea]
MAYNGSAYGYLGSAPPQRDPVPQEIPKEMWFVENGRHYDTFRRGKYMFPCDEEEMDRMDIFHKFFSVARRFDSQLGGLFQRPLPSNPRIMDLGCGTGIWAIDMADQLNQQVHILGWDLSLIQPRQIPPGVIFERRDIEDPWVGVEEGSYDLVHIRMLAGCISNWPSLYAQIFRTLRPGTGQLEHVEIDFRPYYEDGRVPRGSKLLQWAEELHEAMSRAGRPMDMDPSTVGLLQSIGYVDVEQISTRIPFNPWPADEHEKEIGRWFNLGLCQGLHALTLAPLTRMNGYNKEQVDALVNEVRKEICSRNMRVYCTMYVWTARRPPLRV